MARTIDKTGIRDRMLRRLYNRGFNSLSTGSMVRSLAEIWSEETSQVLEDIDYITSQYVLSNATGGFLDILGQLVGLQRNPPIASSVSADDRVIKFYATTGVLSDYLPDSQVSGFKEIPANTRISDPDSVIIYQVEHTLVPEGVSEIYVGARAIETGSQTSVPANNLTSHTLNIDNVAVNNVLSISNGSDLESDSNFRYRISKARTSAAKGNATAIKLAALLTPGISDVRLQSNVYGPGTYKILVIPEGNTVTDEQIRTLEISLRDVTSFGVNIYIEEPTYVSLNMVLQIRTTDSSTNDMDDQSIENARSSVFSYIGDIDMGSTFDPAILEKTILDSDNNIINAEVILFCLDGNPVPVSNYTLDNDELFIPDPSIAEPIRVLI